MSEQARIEIQQTYAYMMDLIDTSNMIEVKKVERYKELMIIHQKCKEEIEFEGVSVVVENGSQRFVKSNPLIADMLKVNTQMIALEKSIKLQHDSAVKLEEKPSNKPKLKLI